jgi:membrane protein
MEPQLPFEATIVRALWSVDTRSLPRWKAWPIVTLRVVFAIARDVLAGNLTLHAMSLVYTTLLSFVPLLALSFSVLKGFGVHNQVEPILLQLLEPLGEQGREITERLIGFVDNVKVGVLGALGLALLFYTVVSLMQKIESAFNDTWRISETRPLARRFSDYLSVLLIGPVLMFSAVGITASLTSSALVGRLTAIEPLGTLVELAGRLTPYLLVGGAFTFIYIFIPNTKVRFRSALLGGFAAGVIWVSAGWGFATFVASSTQYTAIYSAFATLILFLIWLYLNWLILLVGSNIAFYHQHPEYLAVRRGPLWLSNRMSEKLALLVIVVIARSHYRGSPPWSLERLAKRLNTPSEVVERAVLGLERSGLLAKTTDDPSCYLPARPFDVALVKDVLDAVRRIGEERYFGFDRLPHQPTVEKVLSDLDESASEALHGRTIKDLALIERPSVDSSPGLVDTDVASRTGKQEG